MPRPPYRRHRHSERSTNPKVHRIFALRLKDTGLLIRGYRRAAMHPRLAGVYFALLADATSRINRMTPVTRRAPHTAAVTGWTVEEMARVLLDDDQSPVEHVDIEYAHAHFSNTS